MKITNLVLVNIMNTLQDYSKKKLPQKISYAIMRNLMKISSEYEVYDKQLKKIFEDYSDYLIKDEKGNVKISQSGIPIVNDSVSGEYGEQISDLLSIEIDVDLYYINQEVFDYDDKGSYDPMSAQDIMILQSILCKPESDE